MVDERIEIEHLRDILETCEEYREGHHLDRPFMSAYQIAIAFARRYPDHPAVQRHGVGGRGTNSDESLARQIARRLSRAIRTRNAHGIEGAFLSHDRLSEMTFEGPEGERVEVSTLNSKAAHSIFRVRRTSS